MFNRLRKNIKGLALNVGTVVAAFIGLIVFTAIVAAMGDDVLSNITTLNTTFADTLKLNPRVLGQEASVHCSELP